MCIDSTNRQTFENTTPVSCDNNPPNVIAFCPHNPEQFIFSPKPVRKEIPILFDLKHVQTAISVITFSAEDAGILSNAEIIRFWIQGLFTKHSDTTHNLPGKTICFTFQLNLIQTNAQINTILKHNIIHKTFHELEFKMLYRILPPIYTIMVR